MMCILLWCLYLVNEFRLVVFSLEAVSQIPRSFQTQWRGRGGFRTISYGRFSVYCMMRLARFFIAVGLLYAGVQWLAGTTSITELILNAVALSAVLQIDEMIFSALMPKKIQICIQDLEAIKVRYSKGRSQVESTVLLFAICLLMLWPWTNNVGPLSRDMLEVKRQFCGGSQNFVVTDNQLQLVTVGMVTGEYNSSAEETASLLRYSVAQHIWHEDVGTSNIIKFSKDRTTFREDMGMTMYQRNLHDSLCLDFDEIFLTNASHELQEFYRPYFFSASFEAGYPEGATCEAMSNLCHSIEPQGRLVRHVCPRTCGCQDQFTNPVLQVLGEGCSKKCHNERTETMRFSACQDVDLNSSVTLRQDWETFWDTYRPLINNKLSVDFDTAASLSYLTDWIEYIKQVGCEGLSVSTQDPVMRTSWCAGSVFYSPLAFWCPQACGCHQVDIIPDWCPRSCEGCRDHSGPFPDDLGVRDCAQAKMLGLCPLFPVQAALFCAETCEVCPMLYNNGTIV